MKDIIKRFGGKWHHGDSEECFIEIGDLVKFQGLNESFEAGKIELLGKPRLTIMQTWTVDFNFLTESNKYEVSIVLKSKGRIYLTVSKVVNGKLVGLISGMFRK